MALWPQHRSAGSAPTLAAKRWRPLSWSPPPPDRWAAAGWWAPPDRGATETPFIDGAECVRDRGCGAERSSGGPPRGVRFRRRLGGQARAGSLPLLLAGRPDHGALWLSWGGEPLRGRSLTSAVSFALRGRCGKDFSFHMFRHSAATFIENAAPEQSLMAAAVLHHADLRTTQDHY